MATTTKTSPSAISSTTPCQQLQNRLNSKNNQLRNWQDELENLLDNPESDIDKIGTLRNVLEDLNKDLFKLKAEQRRLNCPGTESLLTLDDRQTIISTSSVRRKDAKALEIVLDSFSTQKKQ